MPLITQLFAVLVFACLSFAARGEKLRIVTEPWAPYVYEENGVAKGIDYEVTAEVFKRLGIEVEWQFLPWKRCLAMLEQGLADGVLDIFRTEQRDAQLFYPSEPLSQVEFVLFQANARPHALFRWLGQGEMVQMRGDATHNASIALGQKQLSFAMFKPRIFAGGYQSVHFIL